MVQLLSDISAGGIAVTDNQVIRRKITQNCISSLEEKNRKSRLNQDEIQNIIITEVAKIIKEEY